MTEPMLEQLAFDPWFPVPRSPTAPSARAIRCSGSTQVGTSMPSPPWLELNPVEVYGFEGGWKGAWLDGRLQTQVGPAIRH